MARGRPVNSKADNKPGTVGVHGTKIEGMGLDGEKYRHRCVIFHPQLK